MDQHLHLVPVLQTEEIIGKERPHVSTAGWRGEATVDGEEAAAQQNLLHARMG